MPPIERGSIMKPAPKNWYSRALGTVTERQGMAYWSHYGTAQRITKEQRVSFPNARVVEYGLGFAIQVRTSGDYLNAKLVPSMQAAINAFDRA